MRGSKGRWGCYLGGAICIGAGTASGSLCPPRGGVQFAQAGGANLCNFPSLHLHTLGPPEAALGVSLGDLGGAKWLSLRGGN